MDPETTNSYTVIDKPVIAPNGSIIPKIGNKITLKSWSETQSSQAAITNKFTLGRNQLNANIEKIIIEMQVGDTWKIKAFNPIKQKQEILFLNVVDCEQTQPAVEVSVNVQAEQAKKEGNAFIKDKKYEEAIKSYKNAYDLIEYSCDKEAVQIRLSLISNLALATLNISHFRECLEWCKLYSNESIEPNKKIMYRQVQALKGQKQWKKAKQNISKALQTLKEDKEAVTDFSALREAIEKQQKIQISKQKNFYGKMLG